MPSSLTEAASTPMDAHVKLKTKQNADGNSLLVTRHAPCDRDTTSESEQPPASTRRTVTQHIRNQNAMRLLTIRELTLPKWEVKGAFSDADLVTLKHRRQKWNVCVGLYRDRNHRRANALAVLLAPSIEPAPITSPATFANLSCRLRRDSQTLISVHHTRKIETLLR